jgi:hypothetical protein
MTNGSSSTNKSTSEIVNSEPQIKPANLNNIQNNSIDQLDFNLTSSNSIYQTNDVDFRVGNSFSNMQKVGNKIPTDSGILGAPSLFNEYALFHFYGINDANSLFDRIGNESQASKRYAGKN